MRGRGRRPLGRWLLVLAATLAWPAAAQTTVDASALERAQKLAWDRHFAEAEAIYRNLLRQAPESNAVAIGLASVLLWEGRYREARKLFLKIASASRSDLEAAEGAATAAYWLGDFRTAAREFGTIAAGHPERTSAVQNLRDIVNAARGSSSLQSDLISDDQPYRLWRTEVAASTFSDPLTRWDATVDAVRADNPTLAVVRTTPYVTLSNEVVLPWRRVTFSTTAGVLRWPDGVARLIGGIGVRLRTSAAASFRPIEDGCISLSA